MYRYIETHGSTGTWANRHSSYVDRSDKYMDPQVYEISIYIYIYIYIPIYIGRDLFVDALRVDIHKYTDIHI